MTTIVLPTKAEANDRRNTATVGHTRYAASHFADPAPSATYTPADLREFERYLRENNWTVVGERLQGDDKIEFTYEHTTGAVFYVTYHK